MKVNLNTLAKEITLKEGKKRNTDIAQVKEILKLTLKELAKMSFEDVAKLMIKYK